MITYSKPSKCDVCICGNGPIIIVDFTDSYAPIPLCKRCINSLHIDLDILEEPNGIDVLLTKEVK